MTNLRRVATAIYDTGCADEIMETLRVLLPLILNPDQKKGVEPA